MTYREMLEKIKSMPKEWLDKETGITEKDLFPTSIKSYQDNSIYYFDNCNKDFLKYC